MNTIKSQALSELLSGNVLRVYLSNGCTPILRFYGEYYQILRSKDFYFDPRHTDDRLKEAYLWQKYEFDISSLISFKVVDIEYITENRTYEWEDIKIIED